MELHKSESNVLVFLFSFQTLSMFIIFDKAKDGSGGIVKAQVTSTGLAGKGVGILVKDDPNDGTYVWDDTDGTSNPNWQWYAVCNPKPSFFSAPAGSFANDVGFCCGAAILVLH